MPLLSIMSLTIRYTCGESFAQNETASTYLADTTWSCPAWQPPDAVLAEFHERIDQLRQVSRGAYTRSRRSNGLIEQWDQDNRDAL
jgi:hypothetical protein